jgi:hypothetical protein
MAVDRGLPLLRTCQQDMKTMHFYAVATYRVGEEFSESNHDCGLGFVLGNRVKEAEKYRSC